MGTLLSGLLALQFGWVRALVEARGDLFDEQVRTALVEVQSVLELSTTEFPPPPSPGLSPTSGPLPTASQPCAQKGPCNANRPCAWQTAC